MRALPSIFLAAAFIAGGSTAQASVRLRTRTITAAAAAIELPDADPATMVVAADGRITEEWRRALEAAGARIVTYLPDAAFLVRVPRSRVSAIAAIQGTSFAAAYLTGDKLSPELAAAMAR